VRARLEAGHIERVGARLEALVMANAAPRCGARSKRTETGLAAASEILTLLEKAETSPTWSSAVLAFREARRFVEELMTLNLTVPASRRS
jgi:hypothetical protein